MENGIAPREVYPVNTETAEEQSKRWMERQAKLYKADGILEKHGLTEWKEGCWCQSGAQAGWGPDLDGCESCVTISNASDPLVEIHNDIYSPRVAAIENDLRAIGMTVKVDYKPTPST